MYAFCFIMKSGHGKKRGKEGRSGKRGNKKEGHFYSSHRRTGKIKIGWAKGRKEGRTGVNNLMPFL